MRRSKEAEAVEDDAEVAIAAAVEFEVAEVSIAAEVEFEVVVLTAPVHIEVDETEKLETNIEYFVG